LTEGRTNPVAGILLAVAFVAGLAVVARQDASPNHSSGPAAAPSTREAVAESHLFRQIAETQTPVVVNIRTESRQQTRDLSEFFGREGLFERS
jgi:hypothetical protein